MAKIWGPLTYSRRLPLTALRRSAQVGRASPKGPPGFRQSDASLPTYRQLLTAPVPNCDSAYSRAESHQAERSEPCTLVEQSETSKRVCPIGAQRRLEVRHSKEVGRKDPQGPIGSAH